MKISIIAIKISATTTKISTISIKISATIKI